MRVAIASFRRVPPQFRDDELLCAAITERGAEVERIPWDAEGTDWPAYDAVVIRSTWDYARRRDEFVAWCEAVGPRLHNSAPLVAWNSDKRYLGELEADGVPALHTTFVEPGDAVPELEGEVVVKPNISAGGRDSGRFGPAAHELATELIRSIQASGRAAMVQAYVPTVDTAGETAVLMIDGELAHVLRKRAVLRPDEIAPVRDDAVGAAEVMYDPGLVTPSSAEADEVELAHRVVEAVRERFGYRPLYARVDMIRDVAGAPMLLELEAIEPNFYLSQVPATAAVVADAIVRRVGS